MSYEDERPLLDYMRAEMKDVPDTLIYKRAGEAQMLFFRDHLATRFLKGDSDHNAVNGFVRISGWHTSKSVRLPVYHIKTPKIELWARENFYNWNVTVVCQEELQIPDYFRIDADSRYLFFEGMPQEQQRGLYANNKKEFSFCLFGRGDDYDLYAIVKCIVGQIGLFSVTEMPKIPVRST